MTVETIVITKDEVKAPEGHDQKMIDKVDGVEKELEGVANPPAASEGTRPEWLPEKFKSPEDMAKAYAELEAKQGGKPSDAPKADEVDPAVKPEDAPKASDADAAKAAVEGAGLDFDSLSAEFAQKGELTTESYEALAKGGIPKEMVDRFIDGQKALGAQMEADIKSAAGGADAFDAVATWAADNLSMEEKIAYNKAIDSGDVQQAKFAVAGITAKYKATNPDEPSLLAGKVGAVTGDVYESIAQLTADQKKPEYKKDPAFRKKVEQKLKRSNIL